MNLRTIAEWMGYTVVDELGKVLTLREQWEGWNPLAHWRDCGPVLAKLAQMGLFQVSKEGLIVLVSGKSGAWRYNISRTIVTDDATLRRAVVEIAEQVCKEGKYMIDTPKGRKGSLCVTSSARYFFLARGLGLPVMSSRVLTGIDSMRRAISSRDIGGCSVFDSLRCALFMVEVYRG